MIFKDSYLSGDEKWLAQLMKEYKRDIDLPFKCFCTISGFTNDTARMLKAGGCYSIEFGLQTWNEKMSKGILNRKESNEDAKRVFDICARNRIYYDVDHMFNLPGETFEDHLTGALQYLDLKYLNRIKVHYLVYLPGAPIVQYSVDNGILGQGAADSLATGSISDFYDQGFARPQDKEMVAGFAALYKILPLLPRKMALRLLKKDRMKALRRIPTPVMAALQGVRAVQTRDLRFALYMRQYPLKMLRAFLSAKRSTHS